MRILFDPPAQMDPALVKSLEGGWIEGIILDPEAFRNLAQEPEHEGWKAFYRWELTTADAQLTGVGRQRARAQQALVDGDIERLAKRSFEITYDAWGQSVAERNEMKTDAFEGTGAIPILALIAALDRIKWVLNSGTAGSPRTAMNNSEAYSNNVTSTGLRAKGMGPDSAIADCLRAHQVARESKIQ